ncbi:hypothetical protein ADIARSV_2640 [Arcticibacter svalbardensis MN12-7]|uniref:Uncharacterized protein n=1 Tax=Arcticibacter svalbardensis MN12-7 TaxID=1150600 RepID=R9GZ39_9SPHI|nr:hypothetical protein ADIARSV_2640 [Arcticibacter svalbardensis MN12-7]
MISARMGFKNCMAMLNFIRVPFCLSLDVAERTGRFRVR